MRILRVWFGLQARVSRRTYVLSGVVLMAFKYAADAGIVWLADGRILPPLDFISPLLTTREHMLGTSSGGLLAMAVVALPFLWIGLSMSVRRAADAGWSPWLGLLFAFPFANIALIGMLAVAPSRDRLLGWSGSARQEHSVKSALVGMAGGLVIALAAVGASALFLGQYGTMLFFTAPVLMGAVGAYIYNRGVPRSISSTVAVGFGSVVVASGALLLFAIEGLICVAMAFPLAAVAACIGALIGRALAMHGGSPHAAWPLLVSFPLVTAMGEAVPSRDLEREVITRVWIDAPPAEVWQHLVGFTELPEPSRWWFRLGIAYPVRATIEGQGAGATRRCEFSTGAFLEPITAWEPPARLSFDVSSQPPPMHEWSPYRHIHPPHLDGYFRTRRGEFRLIASGAGTLLEGSTWYTLDLAPASYWVLWSDALIHDIHRRVLRHIARLSEASESQGSHEHRLGQHP